MKAKQTSSSTDFHPYTVELSIESWIDEQILVALHNMSFSVSEKIVLGLVNCPDLLQQVTPLSIAVRLEIMGAVCTKNHSARKE